MELTFYILLTILTIGFTIYFMRMVKTLAALRAEARRDRKRELRSVAFAGSYCQGVGDQAMTASVKTNKFYAPDGTALNPDEYLQFVVSGNSMKLCDIYDGNMLFVKKGFKPEDLTALPLILVIRRRAAKANEAKFKVRRSWIRCAVTDDIKTCLEELMESKKFRQVLDAEQCPEMSVLLDDFFEKRLATYLAHYPDAKEAESDCHDVVISTTWHTDDTKGVRFSIHPVKDIVGIVDYSFTIPKDIIA